MLNRIAHKHASLGVTREQYPVEVRRPTKVPRSASGGPSSSVRTPGSPSVSPNGPCVT